MKRRECAAIEKKLKFRMGSAFGGDFRHGHNHHNGLEKVQMAAMVVASTLSFIHYEER